MIPAAFDEENCVFDSPNPDVLPISAFLNENCVITCWKMTAEEVQEFTQTGRIWLVVHGTGMPPVQLQVSKPFVRIDDDGKPET